MADAAWELPLPAGDVEPPGAPPRPWRLSGRLLVLDPAERLLLVRSRDPEYPDLGEWWEVPGGGVDAGEDTVDAALREVREETGVALERTTVVPAAVWTQELSYLWLGRRRWSRQAIHLACPPVTPEPVADLRYTPEEQATFLAAEWVPLAEVGGLPRTFPDGVAAIVPRLRAGDVIDAGFAVWC
ncbi:NUDIX domain-containing protein [Cryptosporangium aurantiacum]|uniref:NUDIX domain-containing protein n=1 Tax=Cryptosporangium aurantiacum TaxID=134849 RepID=A0A1M7HW43_9ACTN|nr:NUDIX domain-containing protein [Cryptosporangium aurantiacum]SHM32726.1 NUDIX domain-containing protein [Cryptosporangium aurantiacum]